MDKEYDRLKVSTVVVACILLNNLPVEDLILLYFSNSQVFNI